jgi:ABC-type amino acid transport substrate-binding protein
MATFLACGGSDSVEETRSYNIAQGFPFPPWDVGPMEGVGSDVLRAICEANGPMRCEIVVLPAQECFDTDQDGNAVVGSALASGRVDGCMTWFDTPERRRLGVEFGDGFSSGPVPQLIAADGNEQFDDLGESGSLAGAVVGLLSGFFNDADCLAMRYDDFDVSVFPTDTAGRSELVAALLEGEIALAFWDNPNTVPEGAHLVGEGIATCGPDLALAVYPPNSNRRASDELRRDYK